MNKRLLIISTSVILFALYLNLFPFYEVVPLKRPFADFPLNLNGWSGKEYFFDEKILDNLRVKEYLLREYRKDNDRISVYIGYYGSQKEGAQIHSPKNCLPGGGWFKLSEKTDQLNIDGLGLVRFVESVYQKGKEQEIFIYWYKMKNTYITNEYILKLYMIINSLRYGRNDAAFIRLSSLVKKDRVKNMRVMKVFMDDFLPQLKDYLPE